MVQSETLFGEEIQIRHRVSEEDIQSVWSFWIRTFHSKGRTPVLSSLRRRRIHDAIRDYGTDDVIAAINGCSKSPWHMGNNPSGKKYTDISLILRDPEHIERFIEQWDEFRNNQQTTQGW